MNQHRKHAKLTWNNLTCIVALGLCLGCKNPKREREDPASQTIRVMTFNVHHGEGLDGKVDLQRIASLIRQERADLVALQEVDKGVQRTAHRDLPAELAELTGMACVFSNNFHFQGGEYGNAVLTRFPVIAATNSHFQMLRTNEQRGVLQVTVQTARQPLIFMSTHIDYRREDIERLLNVQEIQSITAAQARVPVILCGDFNDTPGSKVHQKLKTTFHDTWELAQQGKGWTYPADNPRKRIDYIWISKSAKLEFLSARVLESTTSDHRPVIVDLKFK